MFGKRKEAMIMKLAAIAATTINGAVARCNMSARTNRIAQGIERAGHEVIAQVIKDAGQ